MDEVTELETSGRQTPTLDFYGGSLMSGFPLFFFVLWAILQSAFFGIGNPNGLVVGILLGLIFGMFFARGDWKHYANAIFDGMTQPVAATAIVAWLWAGMFAETLQAGQFVKGLVWLAHTLQFGPELFPAVTFILAALLATGIGTGYGTTIAFCTLFFPAGVALGTNPVLLFGAILAGAVFGDNLAPVSDTTIVSAVTQNSDIGGVVANRFKYALIAALASLVLYGVAGFTMAEAEIPTGAENLLTQTKNPGGLIHLVSMLIVIVAAIRGRHIIEAITWGLAAAVLFNLLFGLCQVADILLFKIPETASVAKDLAFLPFVQVVPVGSEGVSGSLYSGAIGFFPLIVLVLLIVAAAQIMIKGGGFQALEDVLLQRIIKTVRGAETTMVLGTAIVNAMITINTAAEIAIAPYISRIGRRFNINGYRRANILDANTSALGYIFPWSGGVLVGYTAISGLVDEYTWFTEANIVSPASVWPYVFHGWLLVVVFLLAAWTGFGREYETDRTSEEVSRV
ncbi:MAG: Na+/H+ antiporter NhaC family protein [bacterium]